MAEQKISTMPTLTAIGAGDLIEVSEAGAGGYATKNYDANKLAIKAESVPYSGATTDVNLGSKKIDTTGTITGTNKEIFVTASGSLTAAQCCGTIISNYGMTDADCIIDLPTAAEGLAFVCILPTVRARYFRLRCPAAQSDKIYLAGVAGSDDGYVGVASGYTTMAAISMFTAKESDGGYAWFATIITGSWIAG